MRMGVPGRKKTITQKQNLSVQTQGEWLSDLNQDKIRHKKRTGGDFLGPFSPQQPPGNGASRMFGGTKAIKWRVQAWASRDGSVPGGLLSAPEVLAEGAGLFLADSQGGGPRGQAI